MNKIYLDNNSTTQLDPEILESFLPFFSEKFGNPSSKTHSFGWEAEAYVEESRKKVSKLINANTNEIIFTSGATESNNMALLSTFEFPEKMHFITMSTEHKAILDICKNLEKKGLNVSYIKPNRDGIVDIDKIKKEIKDETKLISIMHANNEIGVIQPIEDISKLCNEKNILFHVDAAQSLGKIEVDVKKINADFISFSSHKIYGPKGIGCLYIKKNTKINPITFGGNQERGLRPGTLPIPLIVAFGKACEIIQRKIKDEANYILKLRKILINNILSEIPDTIINGNLTKRIPGNINFSFPSLNGQTIITCLPNIAVSSGSACTSSSPKPSHVLLEIGLSKSLANSSIRICIGRFNTINEINIASNEIIKAIKLKSNL